MRESIPPVFQMRYVICGLSFVPSIISPSENIYRTVYYAWYQPRIRKGMDPLSGGRDFYVRDNEYVKSCLRMMEREI